MLRFIVKIFYDLMRIYALPAKSGDSFAFIVHPRGYGDIVGNLRFLKIFPRKLVLRFIPLLWPFTLSRITGLKALDTGRELEGWVIGVPLLAHQIMENRQLAKKKIRQAIKIARARGARVVGLGGLTGSVMEGGAGLSRNGETIVTAGRALTTRTIKRYADDVIAKLGISRENLTVAVVGAAGGVGAGVVRMLVREPYKKIILIDLERKLERVRKLLEEIKSEHLQIEITHRVSDVRNADIIITATNAPEAVVESDDVKPGAIIIDDAQPSDISPEIIKGRRDVIVIEAGVIIADTVRVRANFRLANKNETYCCLGEVMCIAASGWNGEYEPGSVTPEISSEIAEIADRLGFKLAPYQAFGTLIDDGRIENVRKILHAT